MRFIAATLVLLTAGVVFGPTAVFAAGADSPERQDIQRQIEDLERRVEGRIEERRLRGLEPQASGSALSSLLETTDINGWVAGSYNYNVEGMHNDGVLLANPGLPFHTRTNTFQVDQVFISLDNAPTQDSRAGFHVDYNWGIVNAAGTGGALHTAYISYLAPVYDDVRLDVGLLPTLVGAEVTEVNGNFNISRGLVWAIQPVTNVGALVSATLADGWTASLGVLNDPVAATLVDGNNEKAVTAQLAHSHDEMDAAVTVVWGEAAPGIDTGFLDIVVGCNPSDKDLSAWFNYTFNWTEIPGASNDVHIHGLAAAARKGVSEDLGVALRSEALITRSGDSAFTYKYSLTLTSDYALTKQLTLMGEARMDLAWIGSHDDGLLPNGRGIPANEVAGVLLAQLLYEF